MHVMNEKWFLLEVSQIEKKLKTNAASGLSRKAARSRLRRDGKNNVFKIEKRSISQCAKRVLADPMLLLMIGVNVIAAVFGRIDTAIVCAAMIALNLFVAIFAYVKASRVSESMAEYSQPKVTLIREGVLYYADSRAVVRGDVVLLGAGDIVPCDARIVSSNDFRVSCYDGERAENGEKTVLKNANAVYNAEGDISPSTCDNMVFAGSHVVCGSARAIAVETGDYTYIGALDGGIQLNNSSESLTALKQLRKISKVYSFILMAMILPITILGIFTFDSENILNTFMMIMAVAVSSLGELIYVIGGIIVSVGLIGLATDENDPAVVKNVEALDRISTPDYLFLLDDAALGDGSYRIVRIVTGDGDFEGKGVFTRELSRFAELVMLLDLARSKSPSSGISEKRPLFEAMSFFGERIGVDKTSFEIRMKNAAYSPMDQSGMESASLVLFGERVTVFVANNKNLLERCSFIRTQGGAIPIDTEIRKELAEIIGETEREGSPIMICASSSFSSTNGLVLEGIAAFAQNSTVKVAQSKERLENSGVKVIAVLKNEDKVKICQVTKMLGIKDKKGLAFCSKLSDDVDKLAANAEQCDVLAGFSNETLTKLVSKLKKEGKNVMISALSADAIKLSEISDVTVSYGMSPYVTSGIDFTRLETSVDSGSEHSREGAQTLRCTGDALVRRSNAKGGGLTSIANMLSTARGIHINIETALTYLVCTQLIRTFIAALVSVAFGILLMTPAQLLFSGLVIDLGAAMAFAFDGYSSPQKIELTYSFKTILKKIKIPLISSAAAALATVSAALPIAYLTQMDVTCATFVATVLFQLVLFFSLRYQNRVKKLFSPISATVAAVSLAAAVLISISPPIAAIFGADKASFISLLIIPMAPAAFILIYFVLNAIKRYKDGI